MSSGLVWVGGFVSGAFLKKCRSELAWCAGTKFLQTTCGVLVQDVSLLGCLAVLLMVCGRLLLKQTRQRSLLTFFDIVAEMKAGRSTSGCRASIRYSRFEPKLSSQWLVLGCRQWGSQKRGSQWQEEARHWWWHCLGSEEGMLLVYLLWLWNCLLILPLLELHKQETGHELARGHPRKQ